MRPGWQELETRRSRARDYEDPTPAPRPPVWLLRRVLPTPFLPDSSTAHGLTSLPWGQRVRLHKAGDAP